MRVISPTSATIASRLLQTQISRITLCFINHDAMVPEVGEITLTDYLRENRNSLSHAKLLDISSNSLVCIVV